MKKTAIGIALTIAVSCNSNGVNNAPAFPTLDSNTVMQGDSNPPILYIDSGQSDTNIALDSAGPMVTPADTNYANKKQ